MIKRDKNGRFIKGSNIGHKVFGGEKTRFEKGHKINVGKHWKVKDPVKRGKYKEDDSRGFQKGNKLGLGKSYWKGKKFSQETKLKMRLAQKKLVSMGKHHWGNGLSTPLRKAIRECFKYRQWRSDIFTRDNFKCVFCEGRGYIEADHYPKSFAEIFYEYNIKSVEDAINCEELWNINNGRTLCKKCHTKTGNHGKRYAK